MQQEAVKKIREGAETAFVTASYRSELSYRPQFLSNNYREGRKVLSSIEDELSQCREFCISVAFITEGGITPLLQTLAELEQRGVSGKILTTDYLNFSEPKALKKLAERKNIELRMFRTNGTASETAGSTHESSEGFHTKGYIFRRDEVYRIIVGSSNMTHRALTVNREWNTRIISTEQGEYAKEILTEFQELWDSPKAVAYEDFICEYEERYRIIQEQRRIAKAESVPSLEAYRLEPNAMQLGFIMNLKDLRERGAEKALLISATGTGKTYASAFALRELGFKRVLFLVHRTQIAKQAMESYRRIFGSKVKMGMLGGGAADYDADFLFGTMQTVSREENLRQFAPDAFQCVVYDEAHHTSAASYRKIMEYFQPEFSLGMTATPDRRDDSLDGKNIYEIFDHNIACEIRLQQAMEEDLLCPFHYFGITDLEMVQDGSGKKEEQPEYFRYLTSDERVRHVMEKAAYFGFSGERVKGLIFCSRIDEARVLSEKMNERGLRTVVLTGADTEQVRAARIEQLVSDETEKEHERNLQFTQTLGIEHYTGPLDYILSVDIFSEGVDVPEINQVIMLRPTESPIVFVQQLGRGLRKAADKEFVVVLDFIGNYNNNFMIPIALSGDRTYNKDNIRRYVLEGGRVIPGASTLHFDEISRKRIFESVDHANFSDIRLIRENYSHLKNKLGRIPTLEDFDRYGEMDVLRIFDNASLGSYYRFLVKYEKDYTVRLSDVEAKMIEFVSKKFASGKRIHELELLRRLLTVREGVLAQFAQCMDEEYRIPVSEECMDNMINILTNEFPSGSGKKTYEDCIFIEPMIPNKDRTNRVMAAYAKQLAYPEQDYRISASLEKMLENPDFYNMLKELIMFGIDRYWRDYCDRYRDTDFVLYRKYTYEDVCRLLNWEHNEVPLNIGGYKFDKKTNTFPVFINYEKADDISDTTKYEDHFTSERTLTAISKSGRSLQSEDVQNFLCAEERGIKVELFVRKNKDDRGSKEFYYLGRMTAAGTAREITMANTSKSAVEIDWLLDRPVREDIYAYLTE